MVKLECFKDFKDCSETFPSSVPACNEQKAPTVSVFSY